MIFHASILLGLLAGAGAGTTPKLPSLAEASKRATLVVFGQVVRLEQGARPVATLEIEHVAKGGATGEVSFFADKVGCCLPRAIIGSRILAFLEPSGLDSPRFRFVGDTDASLDVFPHGGTYYLAMSRTTGIQLPKSVCDPSVKHGLYDCTARLDSVLAQAGLKPVPVAGHKPATFRVVTRTCPPCRLADWLQRAAGPAAQDCGTAAAKAPSPDAIWCASDALGQGRPFTVIVPMQGVDSDIAYAYAVSADGTKVQLQFDSSVEGQGADTGGCAARVSRTTCRALSVVEVAMRKRGESWLSCDGSGQEEVLCEQTQSRTEVLDQRRDVSLLRCDGSEGESRYDSCSILPAAGDAGAITPPRNGPSLVCYSPRPRGTVLAPSRPFPGETVGLWCAAR
jgi:hypothetical protein